MRIYQNQNQTETIQTLQRNISILRILEKK